MISDKATAIELLEKTIGQIRSAPIQEALTYLKVRTVDTSLLLDGDCELTARVLVSQPSRLNH